MGKILIVDDEMSLLRLYELILTINGYEIVGKARNGAEAVVMYKKSEIKPDLIIMDHRMPVKSGLDATKEILNLDPQARIIIATADEDIMEEARSIGIVSFKSKPFSNDKLLRNVKKALKN